MKTKPLIVWLTSGTLGTPHAGALQAANPGLETRVFEGPNSGHDGWKNCDRNIREFWRAQRAGIAAEWLLFLEWDVFCDVNLTAVTSEPKPGVGLVCAKRIAVVRGRRSWMGFGEVGKLPRELRETALGCVPNAVLLISRRALDAVIDPMWDALFSEDMLSELRLGTVVRASGFHVAEEPLWRHVGVLPLDPEKVGGGMFHPVKMEVGHE